VYQTSYTISLKDNKAAAGGVTSE